MDTLGRFENAGLRISSKMDREIVVLRALCEMADLVEADDLSTFFADESSSSVRTSPDLQIFLLLSDETSTFSNFDVTSDFGRAIPHLADCNKGEIIEILKEHSTSIFENAIKITYVNEHAPGTYIEEKVRQFESIACGNIEIESVTETTSRGRLEGHVVLEGGKSWSFEIEDGKRPDITPMFDVMNTIAAQNRKGRFEAILTGTSEDLIAVHLRDDEHAAFLRWSEGLHYGTGISPLASLG